MPNPSIDQLRAERDAYREALGRLVSAAQAVRDTADNYHKANLEPVQRAIGMPLPSVAEADDAITRARKVLTPPTEGKALSPDSQLAGPSPRDTGGLREELIEIRDRLDSEADRAVLADAVTTLALLGGGGGGDERDPETGDPLMNLERKDADA